MAGGVLGVLGAVVLTEQLEEKDRDEGRSERRRTAAGQSFTFMISFCWTGRRLMKMKVFSEAEQLVEDRSAPGLGRKPSRTIWEGKQDGG